MRLEPVNPGFGCLRRCRNAPDPGDKERLMHKRYPDVLWSTIETVLKNIGDLPCWVDTKLAQTIFGGKPNRDFWKKIFADGVSPTGIRVLAKGLDLKSLITPKGAA